MFWLKLTLLPAAHLVLHVTLPHPTLTLLISVFPKHPKFSHLPQGLCTCCARSQARLPWRSPRRPLHLFHVLAQISPSRELLGCPMVRNSMLSLLRARVQSLVGELRSHKLHGMAGENSITFQRDLPALSANPDTQDLGRSCSPTAWPQPSEITSLDYLVAISLPS